MMNTKVISIFVGLMMTLFAMHSAYASNKATVMFVYSDSCRMCNTFEQQVLSDPAVQKELRHFNFKKVLANSVEMDIEVTPTLFIYKGKTQVQKWVPPSMNKAAFIEFLKQNK